MKVQKIRRSSDEASAPTRREVLASGMTFAFLAGLGISTRAYAAKAVTDAPGDRVLTVIPDCPDILNAATPTLPLYVPPDATIRDFPRWTAVFDLFLWEASGKTAKNFRSTNTIMGEMTVSGDPVSGIYQVSEKRTVSGLTTVFNLRLQCDPGPVPHVRSWRVEHRADSYSGSALVEQAEIKKGRIEWAAAPAARAGMKLPPGGLLASGVLFAMAGWLPEIQPFGLLNDGVHVFIPVKLEPNAASVEVLLASGRRASWTSSALYGFGIMPTHLFADERGQNLLVTQGMNGYSLRTVSSWDGKDLTR